MTILRQRIYKNARLGLHPGRYADNEMKQVAGKTLLKHSFFLDDETNEEGEPLRVSKLASLSFARGSTNVSIVHALLGHVPPEIDLDLLVGRRCMLEISHKTDSSGRTWDAIDAVLAPPKDPPPSTPPPPRAVQPGPLFRFMTKQPAQDFILPATPEPR